MKSLMLAFFLLLTASAYGVEYTSVSDVGVKAGLLNHDCHYWSKTTADIVATYRNPNLPWGTRVQLMYGFREKNGNYIVNEWQNGGSKEAGSLAPFTWQAKVAEAEMQGRGGPNFFDFTFVFRVLLPNGDVFYDKGSETAMGYYLADVSSAPRVCDAREIRFADIPIQVVRKDY